MTGGRTLAVGGVLVLASLIAGCAAPEVPPAAEVSSGSAGCPGMASGVGSDEQLDEASLSALEAVGPAVPAGAEVASYVEPQRGVLVVVYGGPGTQALPQSEHRALEQRLSCDLAAPAGLVLELVYTDETVAQQQ